MLFLRQLCRAGLTIRGPHTNVIGGGFFLIREARIFLSVAVHFIPKKLTTFLVVVTFKRTPNVQASKNVVKIWQLIGGGPLPWYYRHNG